MKFCKDCKWYKPSDVMAGSPEYARCLHPASVEVRVSLVTGERQEINPFCNTERGELVGKCGSDAILFDPPYQPTPHVPMGPFAYMGAVRPVGGRGV